MISVIIPTLNSEAVLPRTLAALVPAAVDGLIRQVIVADGRSTDRTRDVADAAGADIVTTAPGRGAQLAAAAATATSDWLLFLEPGTRLIDGWQAETLRFMNGIDAGEARPGAAVYRFRLDDGGLAPRVIEALVTLRTGIFCAPNPDQGLLLTRRLYNEIGGHRDLPILEDVDILRRLGRRRIRTLTAIAEASPQRYRHDGYLWHGLRNNVGLALYRAGLPIERIARIYA